MIGNARTAAIRVQNRAHQSRREHWPSNESNAVPDHEQSVRGTLPGIAWFNQGLPMRWIRLDLTEIHDKDLKLSEDQQTGDPWS